MLLLVITMNNKKEELVDNKSHTSVRKIQINHDLAKSLFPILNVRLKNNTYSQNKSTFFRFFFKKGNYLQTNFDLSDI